MHLINRYVGVRFLDVVYQAIILEGAKAGAERALLDGSDAGGLSAVNIRGFHRFAHSPRLCFFRRHVTQQNSCVGVVVLQMRFKGALREGFVGAVLTLEHSIFVGLSSVVMQIKLAVEHFFADVASYWSARLGRFAMRLEVFPHVVVIHRFKVATLVFAHELGIFESCKKDSRTEKAGNDEKAKQ